MTHSSDVPICQSWSHVEVEKMITTELAKFASRDVVASVKHKTAATFVINTKPSCHIPFMQAFSTLHCILKIITFLSKTNISASKMQCSAETACVNGCGNMALSILSKLSMLSKLCMGVKCRKLQLYIPYILAYKPTRV